jgi:uncharacterized protein involved in exopolysaccharide biosynthesis/Mrp family chromosome partitioning ATPase
LGDIYYTLFRHKGKILACWLAGLAAAFAFYKLKPAPYMSEAKLFIKYVVTEGRSMGPGHDDTMVKTAIDQRGDSIIKSELEILTSLDLAEEVVKSVGAEKILGSTDKPKTDFGAALVVQHGLVAEVLPNSSVIHVAFFHSNPEIAQTVLRELVALYLKKHVEVHMAAGGVADAMSAEKDQLRAQLAQTEDELRKVMSGAGIISLEDSKKSFGEQIARIRQQLFDAQAELAGRVSVLQETTQTPSDGAATSTEKQEAPVPPEQFAAYQKVATRLADLQRREQDAVGYLTDESPRLKDIRAQIADAQDLKKKLENAFPALARVQVVVPNSPNQPGQAGAAAMYSPQVEAAQIASLRARIKALEGQQSEVRADAARVEKLEANILELRRRKELQETNYRNIAASLESSRIDEAIGTGRAPNIIQIETPTPPLKNADKLHKIMAGIAGGGFALGLAWAFAIELFLDRSVRRPADIERTLRLPLFLSIPRLGGKQAKLATSNLPRLPGPTGKGSELAAISEGGNLALTPYYETLRDRLISYFDTLNVRHKPKLVAVTGLGKDTGVTTLAAGLARSFSETGEGNVLLVDMTQGQGSAQHFHKGATVVGLEQLLDTKQSAQVQDNLYVVSENSNSDRLAKGMPQRFNQLIPKLKTSDFDYIIFDMPSINQISVTPRLASFMDMMLLVIESEKTDRDVALQASAMLAKSKAPVGVVLNKTKTYIPPAIHQDRETLLGG